MSDTMPEKVLIVEDEHMLAYVLQNMIESLGVPEVSHAATLADAQNLVDEQQFDFAFLDINLGKESSIPLAHELDRRNVRFVFASGYDSQYEAEGLSAPLLRKPLGLEEIRAALTSDRPDETVERIGRIG
ncbi:response regulator [Parasphingopyxis algicola]|uniref:response regulator n=1 Tax=Parasphingopyxis algicola TaxID=2026624 RepID=UPI00159FAF2A|nr:response regulator [Parasphingopyxis algicola]QLC25987.1 response regulator [Parasphingopyxis algicola]